MGSHSLSLSLYGGGREALFGTYTIAYSQLVLLVVGQHPDIRYPSLAS